MLPSIKKQNAQLTQALEAREPYLLNNYCCSMELNPDSSIIQTIAQSLYRLSCPSFKLYAEAIHLWMLRTETVYTNTGEGKVIPVLN